ncbi:glucan endo-1,3-beta-glucosidase 7 precursor [Iris pallida]|uniref:glucan endo-1,3-beta-D-glucosidase n=1 Tax=Iris pallida TaxID=29817 RepID=A0AAX6F8Z7_IRIPA|nr:glucan endo-1,3-beta-glucosidase 7 precursor [Iris pallida]
MSAINFFFFLFFFLGGHFPFRSSSTSTSLVGINYGLVADNLPSPSSVPPLLRSLGVGRIRLYDADPNVLRSLANTGIEFVVGLPDRCILKAASDPSFSLTWLKSNVQSYLPATKIVAVTVGNEVLTNNDTSYARSLLPAIDSLHSALVSLNLDRQVAITTAHSVAILSSSYPPSAGRFRPDLLPLLCALLSFHARTGSPFLINAYPFFAYKSDPKRISLDYALFQPNDGVLDPTTGLRYDNMLFAQIDAVYAAMKAAGSAAARGVEVRVSETGWPSGGDPDEVGATPENAAKYNGNLMKLVMANKGTPMAPKTPVRVYVFALFNENMKPGPASERNYGLFKPDGTPTYKLDVDFAQDNSTASGSAGSSGGGGDSSAGNSTTDPDYYSISAAVPVWEWQKRAETLVRMGVLLLFTCCCLM